ncbi:hypothetical protein SDC9_93717 [bioreactor metagenome]|uniref:Uncharacterized protein n=1 Tax=bioreactor metagenome TaxID=1076179 RepID=A0A645A1E0_9ZZZZ
MRRDFETVFAGIAAAGDEQVGTVPVELASRHEHQLFYAGDQARQHGGSLGALQRQQTALGHGDLFAAVADAFDDVRNVAHLAGTVDDHEDVLATVEEHQVIDDAAIVIEQQAVALLAFCQADHIHRHQGFEGSCGVGTHQAQLAHVRDIEQTGCLARVVVLCHQPGGVLHGHGVAGKRHHAGAELDVQCVQGRGEQGRSGRGRGHVVQTPRQMIRATHFACRSRLCPAVRFT